MQAIWKLAIGALVIGVILYMCAGPNAQSPDKLRIGQEAINQTAISGFAKYDDGSTLSYSYSFTITYPDEASASSYAATEARALVASALRLYMAAGGHPAEDHASIWVWVSYSTAPGVTGEARSVPVGRAKYNYGADDITFSPCWYDPSYRLLIRCADD
jgi:hypothetical protein